MSKRSFAVPCFFRQFFLVIFAFLWLTACNENSTPSSPQATPPGATKPDPVHKATTPSPRDFNFSWMSIDDWYALAESHRNIARQGNTDLLFVGDSITQGWSFFPDVWNHFYGAYRPANFGIGGDTTGNVLWRLERGELEKINPRAVVLLIGVNNYGVNGDSPKDVFLGVQAVLKKLRAAYPDAKILLNAILPYQKNADSPVRQTVRDTNALIEALADNQQVFFFNYGDIFLEADGSISDTVMHDYLHMTEEGYRRWAAAMVPTLRAWLD